MSSRRFLAMLAALCLVGCDGRISGGLVAGQGGGTGVSAMGTGGTAGTGGGEAPGLPCGGEQLCVGSSGMARLTATEYAQTVRASFGALVAAERFEDLPSDGQAGPFASNDNSPSNEDMVATYRLVAERVSGRIGQQHLVALQCQGAVNDACIDAFISRTALALFRAPSSAAELEPYGTLYRARKMASDEASAVRVTVSAMLQSPRFIYHLRTGSRVQATVEPGPGEVVLLSGPAVAERLSYFLWGTPPDATLLAAATSGGLDTREGVEREARRLLADARADVRLGQFHTQWMGLEQLPFRSFPPNQPAGYDALRTGFYDEVQAFGARVVRQEDATVSTLLTASWTVASPEIARFYGVSGTSGTQRINLPAGQRVGLLTQAGFLATHLHDVSTMAVHRGKAIRELLFCQQIPPPPANIDPRVMADPMKSPRQRLEAKTGDPTCVGCHTLMNPAGYLLEHFDQWGQYRTEVRDEATGQRFPVDATGQIVNVDLDSMLNGHAQAARAMAQSEMLHQCVARQWFRFATGRSERKEDLGALNETWKRYDESGRNLRELIVALAGSDAFRYRRY